ncbi:MAG: hypothetical protein JNM93_09485 [Bacteriovoracaceae bacterium]|nr:hypothetical protein [Bacteriovoracaceae bacterium]
MQLNLKEIEFETNHLENFVSFLTQVLDIEVKIKNNTHVFELSGIKVRIKSDQGWIERSRMTAFTQFDFHFSDISDLEDLKDKHEFFCYRHGLQSQNTQLQQVGDRYTLDLIDPDGRIWKMIYEQQPAVSLTEESHHRYS